MENIYYIFWQSFEKLIFLNLNKLCWQKSQLFISTGLKPESLSGGRMHVRASINLQGGKMFLKMKECEGVSTVRLIVAVHCW